MSLRHDRTTALKSFVSVAFIYMPLAFFILYLIYPKVYLLKNEVIISLSLFALWRYGWMFLNYTRSFLYRFYLYPKLKNKVKKIPQNRRYPKQLYFMIPSYKEDSWVSVETFRSILTEIDSISSEVTIVVATAGREDDYYIKKVFDTYQGDKKINLVFQHQSQGKRIAMGHALRFISRDYHHKNIDDSESITIFMDGDSYMEDGFLKKILPFFMIDKKLGALTTNEVAFIDSKSKWYKDWFNLKFGQRHILFQSHSLSKKVLTLTGRLSAYKTSIVIEEEFINIIENDIITDPIHGKFRFLMGDDKSSWYYLLKNGWNMLYIPDALCISLESRDGKFLELSRSLPYRWFGNTLRNNSRALKLGPKKMGWYIWYAILDQRVIMWTSLVGISSAIILSIFISFYYLLFFLVWIIFIRLFQLFVIALGGHKVSWRIPLLIIYSQWIGSFIKIKAFYNLSDQKWSKNTEEQSSDLDKAHISSPLVSLMPKVMLISSTTAFILALLLSHNVISLPNINLKNIFDLSVSRLEAYTLKDSQKEVVINLSNFGVKEGVKNIATIINHIIKNHKEKAPLVLILPEGELDFYSPIFINRSNITLKGTSKNKTILISHLSTKDEAFIQISGDRGKRIGYVSSDIYQNESKIKFETDLQNIPNFLLIREPNDKKFLDKIGSKVWDKKYPYLRQEIVEVADYNKDKSTIYLKKPLSTDFDRAKSELVELHMISHVVLKNFTIKQFAKDRKIEDFRFDYRNSNRDILVDMISLKYATKCNIKDINILQSGSNAIKLESSYAILIEHIYVDGAWNKGKKGNGYVRFSRTHHSVLRDSIIKNIRHLTLQWSSTKNHLYDLNMSVDINLHGGFTHSNSIDHIKFDIPLKHKWAPIEKCPNDAKWAPPDGKNYINYKSFYYKKGSRLCKY